MPTRVAGKNACCDAVHGFEEFDVSPVHIEVAGPAKDAEFHDDGEDDIKLLEYHSPPLMKDSQSGASGHVKKHRVMMDDDKDSVISE
jgi:hypothetical protein